jgi:hypothetical protein
MHWVLAKYSALEKEMDLGLAMGWVTDSEMDLGLVKCLDLRLDSHWGSPKALELEQVQLESLAPHPDTEMAQ